MHAAFNGVVCVICIKGLVSSRVRDENERETHGEQSRENECYSVNVGVSSHYLLPIGHINWSGVIHLVGKRSFINANAEGGQPIPKQNKQANNTPKKAHATNTKQELQDIYVNITQRNKNMHEGNRNNTKEQITQNKIMRNAIHTHSQKSINNQLLSG